MKGEKVMCMCEDENVGNGVVEKKAGRGRPRQYQYPSELVCTVTGKSVKTNYKQFQKGLESSGKSYDEYIATYVSREGRKVLNAKREEEAKLKETPQGNSESAPEAAS